MCVNAYKPTVVPSTRLSVMLELPRASKFSASSQLHVQSQSRPAGTKLLKWFRLLLSPLRRISSLTFAPPHRNPNPHPLLLFLPPSLPLASSCPPLTRSVEGPSDIWPSPASRGSRRCRLFWQAGTGTPRGPDGDSWTGKRTNKKYTSQNAPAVSNTHTHTHTLWGCMCISKQLQRHTHTHTHTIKQA